MSDPPLRAGPGAWVTLAAGLALGSLVAGAVAPDRLDWQPALAWQQPWRAWTAALVHWSPLHLLANLVGCLLVAALGAVARLPPRSAAAWLLAWPLTELGLLLRPELRHYGGLSGVLHAAVAVAAAHLLVAARGRRRAIGAALLAGLVLKVLGEAPWGPVLAHRSGWDIAVVPFAHASGLVAGIVVGGLAELGPRRAALGARR